MITKTVLVDKKKSKENPEIFLKSLQIVYKYIYYQKIYQLQTDNMFI